MSNPSSTEQATLAVPGVVHVGKTDAPSGGVITTGAAAGWISSGGIREWSHEVSFIARKELTDAVREELGVTLPENRIAKSRHPNAYRAAETSTLIAVVGDLAPRLVEKGIRVHTVGFDRVTGGFMYFVEGGKDEQLRVHGDLLEMIEPSLAGGSSNADIERYLQRFIDRVLLHFSKGLLNEPAVELANALPRLATDARGLAGVDLDAFEAEAAANAEKSSSHEESAKALAAAITSANGKPTIAVPLFGEARAQVQPPMAIMVGGAAVMLPERTLWTVTGPVRAEVKPAPQPVAAAPQPVAAAAKPAAAPTPKPAPVITPVAAKPLVTPAPVSAKPAAAKPAEPRLPTPAAKIPSVLGAKPAEAKPVEAKPVEAKPAIAGTPTPVVEVTPEMKAEPPAQEAAVVVARSVQVIGVGEAPLPPEPKREEPKAEPVVEAKPEPVVEAKPEPVVEAKPEPKPEPVVEPKPEPVVEAKPEPKPEPVVEKKAAAEAKPAKREEPEALAKAEPAPAKSNAMVFVIIAILIAAAAAFFLMKK